jgi:hypothetical protein
VAALSLAQLLLAAALRVLCLRQAAHAAVLTGRGMPRGAFTAGLLARISQR